MELKLKVVGKIDMTTGKGVRAEGYKMPLGDYNEDEFQIKLK